MSKKSSSFIIYVLIVIIVDMCCYACWYCLVYGPVRSSPPSPPWFRMSFNSICVGLQFSQFSLGIRPQINRVGALKKLELTHFYEENVLVATYHHILQELQMVRSQVP